MNEIELEDWLMFVKIAGALDIGAPGRTPYVFRGQADSAWGLIPTLLRESRKSSMCEKEVLQVEQTALSEFRSQAHLYISPNLLSATKDTIGCWTLMQQHGAPTRLLDWCRSIYVAAYFAVTGSPSIAGAIWLVHTSTIDDAMTGRYECAKYPEREAETKERLLKAGAPPVLFFTEVRLKTARMVAQQSCFSICGNVLGDHGAIIAESVPQQTAKELFRKLVVPARLKPLFLRRLRAMNITALSLFPGLDGLAKSVDELVQLGPS